MPILTLNQMRLVLRIGLAHGQSVDNQRAAELVGVVGAGLRRSGRSRASCSTSCPFAGWAVKGGVAYTGTRAVGEAAVRYFEARG